MRTLTIVTGILVAAGCAADAVAQSTHVVTRAPEAFTMRVVTTGLDGPWELTWGPDDHLWATERSGRRIVRINPDDGQRRTLATLQEVHQAVGQEGLLGLALHPDLLNGSPYVYVAFTYDDAPGPALGRRMAIRRYEYVPTPGTLVAPVDLVTGLPAHDDHNGGRLVIGPDRMLYLAIGDQGSNYARNRCTLNRAQELPMPAGIEGHDWSAYQGKILRLDLDGGIPADNPVIDGIRSHVFSVGHRTPLGLAFGPTGLLYESEHGPSTDDEVNLIESGRNYGWPNVAGYPDDKAYVYANWSASAPTPCSELPPGDAVPASVPTRAETDWTHPLFTPPLRTFFTVESAEEVKGVGSATIAPGGLGVYSGDAIPGWRNSILALSLIRGVVYRLQLSEDGRTITGPSIELFATANRYRDIAIHPDGRRFYLATDPSGPSRDADGASRALANPGSVLEFTYRGP